VTGSLRGFITRVHYEGSGRGFSTEGAVLTVAAFLLSVTAFAATQEHPYSRDWTRAHSPHFTAAGNASFQDLRAVLLELEGFRAALLRTQPALRVTPDRPVTVVVFRDERAFAPFRPSAPSGERREGVVGYFLSTREASYMVVAMHRDMRRTFQHLFHEYTHYVVHQNLGRVPGWLNEGLAEYYSTLRADLPARRSILGEPSPSRLATLQAGRLLPLRALLTYDASGAVAHPPERAAAFYAQSWALVHYLQHAEAGRHAARVGAYLEAVAAGAAVDDAVASAFGIPIEELEARLLAYVRRGSYPHRVIQEPADAAPVRVAREAMREADVEALLDALRAAQRPAAATWPSRRDTRARETR
jgi:heme-degrading monooxygenase HmoA